MLSLSNALKLGLAASAFFSSALAAPAAAVEKHTGFEPILSVHWLSKHYKDNGLTVIDIRTEEDYAASHIPGSVNIPFELDSGWSETGAADEVLELPPVEQIHDLLESAGVRWPSRNTRIVLVSAIAGIGGNTAAPRVALSIKYGGIPDDRVAILNGGFPAWQAAGKPSTTRVPTPRRGSVRAEQDLAFISYIDEVAESRNKKDEGVYLVDARASQFYNGSAQDSYVPEGQRGHIESAVGLATPDVFDANGAFISIDTLRERAAAALNTHAAPEKVIVYCHIGRMASTWFYLLSNVLGYENVKLYDGSTNEWGRYYDLVLPSSD